MISRILAVALLGMVAGAPGGVAAEQEKQQPAVAAAGKWLSLVDEGKYGESWKEAAGYFRNAVTADQWEQSARGVRKPLGKLVSRKLKSAKPMTRLPGAPDGDYVVIEFTTSFEHKQSAVETVTPMKDKDGEWRVSGYYIR